MTEYQLVICSSAKESCWQLSDIDHYNFILIGWNQSVPMIDAGVAEVIQKI